MSFKLHSKIAKRYLKAYLEEHTQLESAARLAYTKIFVRW